jgi:hypothetical protein
MTGPISATWTRHLPTAPRTGVGWFSPTKEIPITNTNTLDQITPDPVEEAHVAAAAFLARYSGRTLDVEPRPVRPAPTGPPFHGPRPGPIRAGCPLVHRRTVRPTPRCARRAARPQRLRVGEACGTIAPGRGHHGRSRRRRSLARCSDRGSPLRPADHHDLRPAPTELRPPRRLRGRRLRRPALCGQGTDTRTPARRCLRCG